MADATRGALVIGRFGLGRRVLQSASGDYYTDIN
jgi:hypothetical protein